jgi:hypothetical protein
MSMRVDTADAGYTAEARALLDSLDDTIFVSLGVLFGTDLCALGGTRASGLLGGAEERLAAAR